MTIAAGIDVGTGAVKAAIFKIENGQESWLARSLIRIRQRDPIELARVAFDNILQVFHHGKVEHGWMFFDHFCQSLLSLFIRLVNVVVSFHQCRLG